MNKTNDPITPQELERMCREDADGDPGFSLFDDRRRLLAALEVAQRDLKSVDELLVGRTCELDAALAENARLRELVLAAVEAEPELPGEMPDTVWAATREDAERTLRATVRATKRNIADRITAALAARPGGREKK